MYLVLTSQTEPAQLLIESQVTEHWLHYRHSMTIDLLAFLTINPVLHPGRVVGLLVPPDDEGDLPTMTFPRVGRFRIPHTVLFQLAIPAFAQPSLEEQFGITSVVLTFMA